MRFKNGQTIRDLGGEHIVQSQGKCISCGLETWGFVNDPCPDWRGVFGNRTASVFVASEYGMRGEDITICALCDNTRETYEYGLSRAKAQWVK